MSNRWQHLKSPDQNQNMDARRKHNDVTHCIPGIAAQSERQPQPLVFVPSAYIGVKSTASSAYLREAATRMQGNYGYRKGYFIPTV
jgi:hypothetical protein